MAAKTYTFKLFVKKLFNGESLTEAERYYPYNTKAEHDAAVQDTIDLVIPFFGGGGKRAVEFLAKIVGYEVMANYILDLRTSFLRNLEEKFNAARDSITEINFVEIITKGIIKGIETAINKKVRQDFPYLNRIELLSSTVDGLTSELGVWFADVLNITIGRAIKKPVSAFSTVYPPDRIVPELDIFLTDELNSRMKINLSGVLQNENLNIELRDQLQNKVAEAIMERIAIEKGKLIDRLDKVPIPGASKAQRLAVLNQIIDAAIDTLTSKKTLGFTFNGRVFLHQQYKKALNREHQRNYRKTHREERRWVRKDTGLPEDIGEETEIIPE